MTLSTTVQTPFAETEARVSFRQPVTRTGFVDSAWWPRSRDLAAELPALLAVVWTASREITRVSYSLQFWGPAPRRILVEGRSVRLGGFTYLSPLILTMVDARNSDRIDFLVVPPETEPRVALRALELASASEGISNPAEILELASA